MRMNGGLKAGLVAVILFAAGIATAQDVPALYRVSGVAADDVLVVRQDPDAGAAAIGALAPRATGIEVVALTPDGRWGAVNAGEASGWVRMTYLEAEGAAPWQDLAGPLSCAGTEPFWGATLADGPVLVMSAPGSAARRVPIAASARTAGLRNPPLGLWLGEAGSEGFAVIRAETCSDGMSDRTFGLAIELFEPGEDGLSGLSGCCSLAVR